MRLIDADELKEVLHETIADEDRAKYWYDLIGVDEAINDAPTIDPVRHGWWVETDRDDPCYYYCSECHRQVDMQENYCPNCGARMEVEENE